ncbi:MAG TPA: hypothetical protein VMW38_16225 [Terriglobia bacterium]|nr:hypothetical protein [Terriglobia bacterium]
MTIKPGSIRQIAWVGLAVGMTALATRAADRATADSPNLREVHAALEAPPPGITAEELFSKLLEHNRLRDLRLESYSARRSYELKDLEGNVRAQQSVAVHYTAPETKEFRTTSENGSSVIRKMVFKRLMESEAEAATGQQHHDSSIKPANYSFNIVGEQDIGPYHCIVAEAIPKSQDKYLFEGRIWIDAQDFAIVRIAGHPARKLSFWINRADFVRQYQKIGDFWLPEKDETFVDVKLYGKKVFSIDHHDYRINGQDSEQQARDFTRDGPVAVH